MNRTTPRSRNHRSIAATDASCNCPRLASARVNHHQQVVYSRSVYRCSCNQVTVGSKWYSWDLVSVMMGSLAPMLFDNSYQSCNHPNHTHPHTCTRSPNHHVQRLKRALTMVRITCAPAGVRPLVYISLGFTSQITGSIRQHEQDERQHSAVGGMSVVIPGFGVATAAFVVGSNVMTQQPTRRRHAGM